MTLGPARCQRRIDVLELLRIVEALKVDARAVFMDIMNRRTGPKPRKGLRQGTAPYIRGRVAGLEKPQERPPASPA